MAKNRNFQAWENEPTKKMKPVKKEKYKLNPNQALSDLEDDEEDYSYLFEDDDE